ncbi:unnamed protein product [Tetraodon nigroviridis]|uniref:(spotted green pufferfish) hypothetical protein n=1 Tax=Tetraodon nigroviridis TaxID=99883 RepID=Q4SJI1_TETNG|nr:unnamed protein product [Tetraodon nigroviridis]
MAARERRTFPSCHLHLDGGGSERPAPALCIRSSKEDGLVSAKAELPSCGLVAADGLQCYGCNIIHGQRYVDVGCSNPEVITCAHSHKGFKHRFCIKTESTALGIVLTSGCATSRHCQQQELPGVRIHCCDSDLCNSASSRHAGTLHYISALLSLLMLKMWL